MSRKHTAYITIVIDACRDMWEAGHGETHEESFEAAYRQSAANLARTVNRRLGGHRLVIEVVSGRYEGPEMQHVNEPDGIEVWQGIHDLTHGDGTPSGWAGGTPGDRDPIVRDLRAWVLEQAHVGAA